LKKRDLLIIFARNPVLGKCKTRLAAKIGEHAALEVYKFLLKHTFTITKDLLVTKEIHYSETIVENDLWGHESFIKKQQFGDDLGHRMENAFRDGFANGFQNIIIIGCDMYDINQKDLENAFAALEAHDAVIGPAVDGGYYLLGMKSLLPSIFKEKLWGTNTVLEATLNDLKPHNTKLLDVRNDVDYYEDIKDIDVFQKMITE